MHPRVEAVLDLCGLVRVAEHPELATTLRRLVATGELARPFPGVYLRPSDLDPSLWLRAVCAWAPHAVVHARSAVALWLGESVQRPLELVNARTLRPCPGVRIVARVLGPELVVERAGVRVVTPAYAFAEVAATDDGRAAERGFRQRLVTPEQVLAAGRQLVATPGNVARSRVLAELATNPWSAAERRLHAALRRAHIGGWVANARIRVGGRLVVGDVLFVEERLILEVDGFEYHSAADDFQRDRERQNLLTLAGYRVLRFTWDQLEHPDYVLGQVRRALRGRNP